MSSRPTRGHRGNRHREVHDESHGSHERWLVTYADMLTLLLVLFIVLYAMSVVDTTKFVQLRAGLAAVFNPGQNSIADQNGSVTSSDDGGSAPVASVNPQLLPSPAATTILDQQVAAAVSAQQRAAAQQQGQRVQTEVDEFKQIEQAVSTALAAKGLAGSALFNIDERGLVITIVTDTLVFGGNSAVLLPGGTTILDGVAPPLLKFTNQIEVDGNTNQQNVSTAPYPSGWELSSARASSVVRYLIASFDFPESRLSAVGFSDQRPLYPPSDPRSITLNRRVDIVVLSNLSAADRALLTTVGAEPAK
jgi:chemotaxis protein MotB